MLQRTPFKTATELAITEVQHRALVLALDYLESGKLPHMIPPDEEGAHLTTIEPVGFNMESWSCTFEHCGTICCIGGLAEYLGKVSLRCANPDRIPKALESLLYPFELPDSVWVKITPLQAASALREYLTTGQVHWTDHVR